MLKLISILSLFALMTITSACAQKLADAAPAPQAAAPVQTPEQKASALVEPVVALYWTKAAEAVGLDYIVGYSPSVDHYALIYKRFGLDIVLVLHHNGNVAGYTFAMGDFYDIYAD